THKSALFLPFTTIFFFLLYYHKSAVVITAILLLELNSSCRRYWLLVPGLCIPRRLKCSAGNPCEPGTLQTHCTEPDTPSTSSSCRPTATNPPRNSTVR